MVCDLDGVVYAGPTAIEHAVDSLNAARKAVRGIVYATNNASRPPASVASHLEELGLEVEPQDVVNSSMAGAHVLAERFVPGTPVLAVGGTGVRDALQETGLGVVTPDEAAQGHQCQAVLQGYGADVTATDLAEAAYAIQSGATWVATNTDRTLPTDRGKAPGNGSLVAAVRCAVDVEPEAVGKPEPVMYTMAAQRLELGEHEVLAVGDRLETDIEGAVRGGLDSVLVLTGVHGLVDAAGADTSCRPTYVIDDLRGLHEEYCVDAGSDGMPGHRAALMDLWARVDAGSIDADAARSAMAERLGQADEAPGQRRD